MAKSFFWAVLLSFCVLAGLPHASKANVLTSVQSGLDTESTTWDLGIAASPGDTLIIATGDTVEFNGQSPSGGNGNQYSVVVISLGGFAKKTGNTSSQIKVADSLYIGSGGSIIGAGVLRASQGLSIHVDGGSIDSSIQTRVISLPMTVSGTVDSAKTLGSWHQNNADITITAGSHIAIDRLTNVQHHDVALESGNPAKGQFTRLDIMHGDAPNGLKFVQGAHTHIYFWNGTIGTSDPDQHKTSWIHMLADEVFSNTIMEGGLDIMGGIVDLINVSVNKLRASFSGVVNLGNSSNDLNRTVISIDSVIVDGFATMTSLGRKSGNEVWSFGPIVVKDAATLDLHHENILDSTILRGGLAVAPTANFLFNGKYTYRVACPDTIECLVGGNIGTPDSALRMKANSVTLAETPFGIRDYDDSMYVQLFGPDTAVVIHRDGVVVLKGSQAGFLGQYINLGGETIYESDSHQVIFVSDSGYNVLTVASHDTAVLSLSGPTYAKEVRLANSLLKLNGHHLTTNFDGASSLDGDSWIVTDSQGAFIHTVYPYASPSSSIELPVGDTDEFFPVFLTLDDWTRAGPPDSSLLVVNAYGTAPCNNCFSSWAEVSIHIDTVNTQVNEVSGYMLLDPSMYRGGRPTDVIAKTDGQIIDIGDLHPTIDSAFFQLDGMFDWIGVANFLKFTSVDIQHVTCPGDTNGAIRVSVSGGKPPYSYLWSTGDTLDSLANVGPGIYSLTVTDSAGFGISRTDTIGILDTIAPTLVCNSDTVVGNDPGDCGAIVGYRIDLADNCPNPVATLVAGNTSGARFPLGITVVRLDAADSTGNTASCSFTITVNDTEGPSITCPADTAVATDPFACDVFISYEDPVVTDNCTGLSFTRTSGLETDEYFPAGTNVVSFEATDTAGNMATCSFVITVVDSTPPTITCPANITQDNDAGLCSAVVTFSLPGGADNCTVDTVVVSSGLVSGSVFPVGVTTESLTVSDTAGNTASCNFTITVNDTLAPTAQCQHATVHLDAGGTVSTSSSTIDNGSSDACGTDTIVLSQTSFGCSEIGTNPETLTVIDMHGNTATCGATITVVDTIQPTITCPANITQDNDAGVCSAVVTFATPSGADNCAGQTVTVSTGLPSGSSFPVGMTNQELAVTDASGNTASCGFSITVSDVEAPALTCPNDTIVATDANDCDRNVVYPALNANDNCPGMVASLLSGGVSGSSFGLGITTVAWQATDGAGNTATCDFTITVVDTISPSVGCQNTSVYLDAGGSAGLVPADIELGSSDNCSSIGFSISTNAFGCSDLGSNAVTLTATDTAGNTATCGATVAVIDTISPLAICRNVTIQLDTNQMGFLTTDSVNNGSSDACGGISLSLTQFSATDTFNCDSVGKNYVEYLVVTDLSGNASTCSADIRVSSQLSGGEDFILAQESHVAYDWWNDTLLSETKQRGTDRKHRAFEKTDVRMLPSSGGFELLASIANVNLPERNAGSFMYQRYDADHNLVFQKAYGLGYGIPDSFIAKKDYFGTDVAFVGDIDGNGYTDWAIGAPHHDPADRKAKDSGGVLVLLMGPDYTILSCTWIHHGSGGVLDGLAKKDHFGAAVTGAGDINNDGIPDLLVGAPDDDDGFGQNNNRGKSKGAVYCVLLNADGSAKDAFKYSSLTHTALQGLDNIGFFGYSIVSQGDLDKDGNPEFWASAPGTDLWGAGNRNKGGGFMLEIGPDGQLTEVVEMTPNNPNGMDVSLLGNNDWCGVGYTVVPDLNGDGFADRIVSAHKADSWQVSAKRSGEQGKLIVWFMDSTGKSIIGQAQLGEANMALDSLFPGDHIGTSIFVIGTDSTTGLPILFVASPGYDGAGNHFHNASGKPTSGIWQAGGFWIVYLGYGCGASPAPKTAYAEDKPGETPEAKEGMLLSLTIAPNPNTGSFRIISSEVLRSIQLADINGRAIYQATGLDIKEISLEGISRGTYFAIGKTTDGEKAHHMVIVQ